MSSLYQLKDDLLACGSPAKAKFLARFFKTGPGEYAHGDVFIGVTVPQTRAVARKYRDLSLSDTRTLLSSDIHEERLCALLILVQKFQTGDTAMRRRIYRLYLANAAHINNWDLVDLSADKIVGQYILENRTGGAVLVRLAKSKNIWRRRIAILATFQCIKAGQHIPTFNIARILIRDPHDLIHKAVGWMLREVGKRIGQDVEEEFLRVHYRKMPRTMLRYAIERFPRRRYLAYLKGAV